MISDTYQVYEVTCLVNQKRYIGITKRPVSQRWSEHRLQARHGSRSTFHHAIRKYGPEAFSVELLGFGMSREDALACEIALIEGCGTLRPRGYNSTTGGEGAPGVEYPSRKGQGAGRKRSDETRARMSAARQNNPKALAAAHRGLEAARIVAHSSEVQARRRLGRKHSEETKEKMSAARRAWYAAHRAAKSD